MENLKDYMMRSRQERQAHLDLTTPCDERGGSSGEFRGLLAYYVDTTLPVAPHGRHSQLCHACHNGKCSNVKHLYWGTAHDNAIDYQLSKGEMLRIPVKRIPRHVLSKGAKFSPEK